MIFLNLCQFLWTTLYLSGEDTFDMIVDVK